MKEYIIGNGPLLTLNDENRIIMLGGVYVKNGKIEKIGWSKVLRKYHPNIPFIDVENRLIMPGLINTHTHFYSTFARGMGLKDAPPTNFIETLERLWWRLDKALTEDDIYYSTLISLISSIRSGVTTIIDHHSSPNAIPYSLDIIAKAVKKCHLRACLCYEVSDRDGSEITQKAIEENIRFAKRCKEEKNPMLSALFGLHASFTLSPETLETCAGLAKDLDIGLHIHTAEDIADVVNSANKYLCGVVERLYNNGILGNKTIAAHCIHIVESEMDLLKETNTNVIHNPQSNMNNAVGRMRVLEMIEKGIPVGLGSDGMTSNILEEMRCAYLLHRHTLKNPQIAFVESINMLLKNNAKIANKYFPDKIGVIEKGAAADIIVLNYHHPTPFNEETWMGHFLFGVYNAKVDTTIVNGRILMQDGIIKNSKLNENHIATRARKLARKLWARF